MWSAQMPHIVLNATGEISSPDQKADQGRAEATIEGKTLSEDHMRSFIVARVFHRNWYGLPRNVKEMHWWDESILLTGSVYTM